MKGIKGSLKRDFTGYLLVYISQLHNEEKLCITMNSNILSLGIQFNFQITFLRNLK